MRAYFSYSMYFHHMRIEATHTYACVCMSLLSKTIKMTYERDKKKFLLHLALKALRKKTWLAFKSEPQESANSASLASLGSRIFCLPRFTRMQKWGTFWCPFFQNLALLDFCKKYCKSRFTRDMQTNQRTLAIARVRVDWALSRLTFTSSPYLFP